VSSSGLTRRPFKEQELPNFKSSLVKNSDNKKIIGSKPDNDTTTQFQKILLDKSSLELKLIQKIRDEAHRFAITFNRDSRIKASKKNILESLP
jgi:excinuclease UvrABC nuclease subunit